MHSLNIVSKFIKVTTSALIVIALMGLVIPLNKAFAAPTESDSEVNGIIHVFAFEGSDAILIESDGEFAMVDSGEDSDYPSGEDERYPLRDGVIKGNGKEDQVIQY